MIKIFLIILNWNRAKDTIECLKSVSKLRVKDYGLFIVVIDNNSKDDSVKRIQNLKFEIQDFESKLKVIKNDKNLGFAAGNNVGIKYALEKGADYVMVLNNDTLVDKDLVVNLVELVKKYKNFGAASPKIYFERGFEFHKERYKNKDLGRVIWYAGGEIDWDNVYGKMRGVDEVDKGQYDNVTKTDFATGACMLISRRALESVGLFDERYFMYYEDTDLSVRITKKGFEVLYLPQGIVWHKVSRSSGIGSDLNDYFISRNRLIFGMRYASLRTKFALFRESLRILFSGRKWQKKGVLDFYLRRFGEGSWPS